MSRRGAIQRICGSTLVLGSGTGFLIVHTAHWLSAGEDLSTALFGIVVPGLLALVLVGCGCWLLRSEFAPGEICRVGIWCLVGIGAMGAAGALIVLYQQAEGVAMSDGFFVIANEATIGAVVGCVLGVYDSRQRATSEQLLAERDRTESLNQRLTVLNRVLRHDVRTHVNVIDGHVALLAERVGGEDCEDRSLRVVERRLNEIDRLSEDARRVERLLDGETHTAPIDLVAVVERGARRACREDRTAGNVELELECPDREYVATNDLFDAALRSVLDGVIEREESRTARVAVSVSRVSTDEDGEYAEVLIECEGGLTPRGLDALGRTDGETPLDHADGLGLWLARWIIEESGGQVTLERDENGGTVVSIRLRPTDPRVGSGAGSEAEVAAPPQ